MKPVILIDRYTGTSTSWQKVVEWKVGDAWGLPKGKLMELGLVSSDYSKTSFRINIMGKDLIENKQVQAATNIPFYEPLKLSKGDKVTVHAKSTDGTSVTVDARIVGVELDEGED